VLGTRVSECVAALAAYADRLVTLVASDRASAHQYVGYLSDGRIHRLLIKPTAVGAARLLIESATARRLQLREEAANDAAPVSVVPAPRRKAARGAGVAAVGVAVAALAAAAFFGSRLGWFERAAPAETAAAPALTAAPASAEPTPDERLAAIRAKAVLALQEGRLAEPVGDNALDHYRAILALAPADEAARDGVAAVVETLFTRAEEALLADELQTAATALDHARRAVPASSRLAFLDAQLARALAALTAAPAPSVTAATVSASAPVAAAPTELDSVLGLATARLRRGQLVSPPGDSASAYFDRAVELAPADARVARMRVDLTAALIAAANVVAQADLDAAVALAAEARRVGGASADLAALESDLGAARARAEQQRLAERLSTARARIQSGALFAPAGDSALDLLAGLQADAPTLAGLAEAWAAFQPAAVASIEGALARREWGTAESQLAGLARAPGGVALTAPLAAELEAGKLQESYLANAVAASALTLQSSVPAVYPPDLLARGVEGWVDLEYVVDRDGRTRDVVATGASAPGRFDAAAVDAVRQFRYVPFERDGRTYERRIKMRMRFQVQ
jgi:TonB family protein